MGYKCSFMDNEAYTAQDVNDAIGRIAGDGAVFSDAGDTLADLNTALAGIVGSGTQLCGCGVTETDGVYKIGAGTCFMEDGSQKIQLMSLCRRHRAAEILCRWRKLRRTEASVIHANSRRRRWC